jgi:phage terminase small subunit
MIAPPPHLSELAAEIWNELQAGGTMPAPGFDAYCNQMAVERQASRKIAIEGLIVADAKGNPVPHPALDIQRKAQAEVRLWAGKFRMVRR